MLRELRIENIAVIERADIVFDTGLNVMTGETGAGKSIVIDSIAAVTGSRISRELIRKGTDRATVTAVFDMVNAQDWLRENDIDCDDTELIVQRRITAEGKSSFSMKKSIYPLWTVMLRWILMNTGKTF